MLCQISTYSPSGVVRIYQAKYSCMCYNLHLLIRYRYLSSVLTSTAASGAGILVGSSLSAHGLKMIWLIAGVAGLSICCTAGTVS